MTSPWTILEIEATNDAREVRRAYARKLKKTRPDEDGEAFQALHEAYKHARYLAENGFALDSDDDLGDETVEASVFALEPDQQISDTPIAVDLSEDMPSDAQAAESLVQDSGLEVFSLADFRPLLDLVDGLLASDQELHSVENWKPLEQDDRLLTEAYRHTLGDAVLTRVIAHGKACAEAGNDYGALRPIVLQYLDMLFGWSNRYDDYLYYSPYEETDLEFLLNLREERPAHTASQFGVKGGGRVYLAAEDSFSHERLMYFADGWRRLAAFLIDYVIVAMIYLLLKSQLGHSPAFHNPLSIFAIYLFLAALCEGSRWSGTPGKRLLGLRTLTVKYLPLSFLHSFGRAVSLGVVVGALAYLNSLLPISISVWTTILVPIAVTSAVSGGRCPQDFASWSVVVNYRKFESG